MLKVEDSITPLSRIAQGSSSRSSREPVARMLRLLQVSQNGYSPLRLLVRVRKGNPSQFNFVVWSRKAAAGRMGPFGPRG